MGSEMCIRDSYNLELFSNWREETTSDPGDGDDSGINLAGARYQSSSSSSSSATGHGGCAIHGWTATHRTSDCVVVRAMDSETWLRTARAVNACMVCGQWYRRGHRCLANPCDDCGRPGHAAFRCRHRDTDRQQVGRTPSTAAPYQGGPSRERSRSRDRRRFPDSAPPSSSASKRSRSHSQPGDKRHKAAPREHQGGDSQPPASSSSERQGRGRGNRGKKTPGGKLKTPGKE